MDPKAGQPVDQNNLTDISELISRYYEIEPELDDPSQLVVFGTSGHRGTSLPRKLYRRSYYGNYSGHL